MVIFLFKKKVFSCFEFKASKKNILVGKELSDIVNDLGGFYLAKDAILKDYQFNPSLNQDEFLKYRNISINSEQSNRLKL